MNRENYINTLRSELVDMVAEYLSPVAVRWGYSEVKLESNIKWRPLVLVIGNYSSGKSTLINEFVGADIQATGQAPTDDSFTVISYDEAATDGEIRMTEERDGKYLLNDPDFPFETLKKHGHRFASHFRFKKVNSPFLKNLAIIDTPGMHDSITEQDRGYNYQEVIGDFAHIADLILVLFDPHKAGTVREAHTSLRETLPAHTSEDRVLFVLNRIDECSSLIDLLRVYGTLCWNLSQMTGRKDIPLIRLTYSPREAKAFQNRPEHDLSYLRYLENQREELKKVILDAPRYRLDHLASFVETHAERLSQYLEALVTYRNKFNLFRFKYTLAGFLINGSIASLITFGVSLSGLLGSKLQLLLGLDSILIGLGMVAWFTFFMNSYEEQFHEKQVNNFDKLVSLDNQTNRDTWKSIRGLVYKFLNKTRGRYSNWDVKQDLSDVNLVSKRGTQEIRESLNELANLKQDGPNAPKLSLKRKDKTVLDYIDDGYNPLY